MVLTAVKANIVDIAADSIVLPANEHLKEGPGASRAIFNAAGRTELTKACRAIKHCDMGSAVPTPAYSLNAQYIIHAVVPKWIDGEHDEYALLSSAYLSALSLADQLRCKSIAFPLLASGNNKFSATLAAQIAYESITRFEGEALTDAILVLYDDVAETIFKSMGIDVVLSHSTSRAESNTLDEIGNKIMSAVNWLGKRENQQKILSTGRFIAEISATIIGVASSFSELSNDKK